MICKVLKAMNESRESRTKSYFRNLKSLWSLPINNPRLLEAQYLALSRQLPLMYVILIVNTWSLAVTHMDSAPRWLVIYVPLAMTILCWLRGVMWWRTRKNSASSTSIQRELARTIRLAPPIALGFTIWSLALLPYGNVYAQSYVAFYMAITVIAVIFSMMHLRAAAQSTALIVNVVFVVYFCTEENSVFVAMSLNVLLVSITMLIILNNHYRTFKTMVDAQAVAEKLISENLNLANHDTLTGLPNRRLFFSTLETEVLRAKKNSYRLAVSVIDLDGFKSVNDQYGHSVGDKLLIEVSKRLILMLGRGTHLSRLGGDEFALIVFENTDDESLAAIGQCVCDALAEPFLLNDFPVYIGCSIGMVTFPDMATNATEAFEYADYALYENKRNRRGSISIFSNSHSQKILTEGMTEQALRGANLDKEFSIVFQPMIDIRTGKTVSFEALARWCSPELGEVSPFHFVPLAERIGLINNITLNLLRRALIVAADWPTHIRLSFNLSAYDCGSDLVVKEIVCSIESSGFDPKRLDLEITETAIIQDLLHVQKTIELFRELGCGVALDDFGTGYSSLSQLHLLNFTTIKIDRSFVIDVHKKPASYKIVKSLIALSDDMGLECVVEGVESEKELEALIGLGCRFVQGYYYSIPMLPTSVKSWLEKND